MAPDCSGIRAVAVHPDETNFVVARENGSFMRVEVEYFQNMPHFTVARHTGGCRRRTVTSMHYWIWRGENDAVQSGMEAVRSPSLPIAAGEEGRRGGTAMGPREEMGVLIVTYLSGQMVLYDSQTLFPIQIQQRTGGALWGSSWVPSFSDGRLFTAVGDGSWQQWHLFPTTTTITSSSSSSPMASSSSEEETSASHRLRIEVELEHVIPRVVGAHRALSVHAHLTACFAAGTDDAGHVVGWRFGVPPSSARSARTTGREEGDRDSHLPSRRDGLDGGVGRARGAERPPEHYYSDLSSSLRGGSRRGGAGGSKEEAEKGTIEVLWTRSLPKGMGLCCCVCMGGGVGHRTRRAGGGKHFLFTLFSFATL